MADNPASPLSGRAAAPPPGLRRLRRSFLGDSVWPTQESPGRNKRLCYTLKKRSKALGQSDCDVVTGKAPYIGESPTENICV
jgi:hypothetical protein